MKNIHLLPTDKPSRLWINNLRRRLELDEFPEQHPTNIAKHIYITSDEEIKEGDWHFNLALNLVEKTTSFHNGLLCEKIILTTDQDLIEDGVQAIDDEFLEWFVKNPSCEFVKIESWQTKGEWNLDYKIIIPQEDTKQEKCIYCNNKGYINNHIESVKIDCLHCNTAEKTKQETPEEAAQKQWGNVHRTGVLGFIEGANWQAKRMYSEEEVLMIISSFKEYLTFGDEIDEKEWFEQFKKK
jgi:hypothetical protein